MGFSVNRRSSLRSPACAGKRSCAACPSSRQGDHPRVCREKDAAPSPGVMDEGSPPRVRGKENHAVRCWGVYRITPACAGKRAVIAATDAIPRDHPRVCGEKAAPTTGRASILGSPPRVRGKVNSLITNYNNVGITPACAGKSGQGRLYLGVLWDHPRVCGEKRLEAEISGNARGSPPRVRGKACPQLRSVCRCRITPACAGKSTAGSILPLLRKDHPRVCGEKTKESLKK